MCWTFRVFFSSQVYFFSPAQTFLSISALVNFMLSVWYSHCWDFGFQPWVITMTFLSFVKFSKNVFRDTNSTVCLIYLKQNSQYCPFRSNTESSTAVKTLRFDWYDVLGFRTFSASFALYVWLNVEHCKQQCGFGGIWIIDDTSSNDSKYILII